MKLVLATSLLLLSGSAAAFKPSKGRMEMPALNKVVANGIAAGVIAGATLLPLAGPALAADTDLVIGTPLESKLANFGKSSYSVFNSVTDVNPLAEKFVAFIDSKVKAPDSADVAQKAVDGLLAIPDAKVNEYAGILKQVVYSGVKADSCVTLGGSGAGAKTLASSAAIKSVDPAKVDALKKKFKSANSSVPVKGGNICLPGSAAASEKLWVAQAELTLSMPKTEATALIGAIKKAGAQTPRTAIASLVPAAESAFSKSPEALVMVKAGKDVEPNVIATVIAAIK